MTTIAPQDCDFDLESQVGALEEASTPRPAGRLREMLGMQQGKAFQMEGTACANA